MPRVERGASGHLSVPRQVLTTVFRKVFRYQATAAFGSSITVNDVLDQYFIATAANAGNRIASAMKILFIEAWAPPIVAGAITNTQQLAFQWARTVTGIGAPSLLHSDTALGTSDLAHLRERPPRGSFADSWLSATSDTGALCNLFAPVGSIVDLHVLIAMPEGAAITGGAAVAVVSTIASATIGDFYVRGFPPGNGTAVLSAQGASNN